MAPLSPPEPGQAVLEIGCGTGPVTAAFGAHGLEPTGVEVVPEFVALARASFPNASFEVAEPTALPFPDGSFRYVVSLSVIERVDDWEAALAEAARVLEQGGVLYLVTTNRWCPKQYQVRYFWGFGYLPIAARRAVNAFLLDHRPELLGYTEYPAEHWFSHGQLEDALRRLGLTPFHKFLLMRPEDIPSRYRPRLVRRAIELLIRHPLPLMYPFDPVTTVVAQKPRAQPR